MVRYVKPVFVDRASDWLSAFLCNVIVESDWLTLTAWVCSDWLVLRRLLLKVGKDQRSPDFAQRFNFTRCKSLFFFLEMDQAPLGYLIARQLQAQE